MTYAELFAGIGGWSVGLQPCGWELKWQCEIDPWCQSQLRTKFGVPVYCDIRTIVGESPGRVDTIVASPPCQPFSIAGRKKGTSDDRNLWPATLAVVESLGPTWFLCENVSNIANMGLALWQDDLESIGYQSLAFDIPNCAIGLPSVERHVWIVAARGGVELEGGGKECISNVSELEQVIGERRAVNYGSSRRPPIADLPNARTLRSRKGVPDFVHRIRAIGNAVPPQIVYQIGQAINLIETTKDK